MITKKEYYETLDKIEELDPILDFDLIEKLITLMFEYKEEHYANGIPPNVLANALQNPIHKNLPKAKAAKSIKNK